jgi:metallo-beta-lactamase family protein
LRRAGRIPDVPTYLNSPMAVHATELFCRFADQHRLSPEECAAMCEDVRFVRTAEETKRLTARHEPAIVLAASGMATGGRVLHHLEQLAPDRRNTVLFTGFQAAGTRGDALVRGAPTVRVYGGEVPVRAEVATLDSLSAHADADELLAWLATADSPPDAVTVVHGEPLAADTLRRRIHDELGWPARVAAHGDGVDVRTLHAQGH